MKRAIAFVFLCTLAACGGEEAEQGECHYARGEAREGIASDATSVVEASLKLRAEADAIDEGLLAERRALATALKVDTEVTDAAVDDQIVDHLFAKTSALAKNEACTFDFQSDFDPKSDAPFGSGAPQVKYTIVCVPGHDVPDARALGDLLATRLPKILDAAVKARRLLPEAKALCERAGRVAQQKEANEEMASYAEVVCAGKDMCALSKSSPVAFAARLVDAATAQPPTAPSKP